MENNLIWEMEGGAKEENVTEGEACHLSLYEGFTCGSRHNIRSQSRAR